MDVEAMLAYFEVTTIGVLMLAIAPVLLAMGAAAFAPMLVAMKRAVLGVGRRRPQSLTGRAARFDHLPGELAALGEDTVALLDELDHFSRGAVAVSASQTPRWWGRIGTAFGDASGYQAETRTAQEVWQWVFSAQRLSADRIAELRALGIDPGQVRAELLSSSSLRERLPSLLAELERITDALAGYAGTDYRGRPLARSTRPQSADRGCEPATGAEAQALRAKRYQEIERRYGGILKRIAARHTRSPADRDDLLQDIRLAIWNALPAYRGESSLRTYAVRIAHNRAATALRRPPPSAQAPQAPAPQPDMEQQLEAASRRGWLTRAIAQLSPGVADALERRLAGDSYQEIAEALGITTSNVGVRLHTAKAHLRALASKEH